MTKLIQLGNNGHAIVNDEDYNYLMQWRWTWQTKGPSGRVVRRASQKTVFIHRAIVERYTTIPPGMEIDHCDRNPRNNTRENLRICTHIQNSYNHKGYGGKSPYKGVKQKGKSGWEACINVNTKPMYLGSFRDQIEAAKAYDAAARIYHGEFAYLNFPESE